MTKQTISQIQNAEGPKEEFFFSEPHPKRTPQRPHFEPPLPVMTKAHEN